MMLWRALRKLVLGLAAICLSIPAHAIDPNRTMAQYMRERWGADRGFPNGSVTAITQTRDGYLWIGTDQGLVRFDGSTFRSFPQATPTIFHIGAVQTLMADTEGGLWIVLGSTQILRYLDGKFELGHDEAQFGITSVASRGDGSVLLSSLALGLLRFSGNKYETLTTAEPASTGPNDVLSSRLSSATGVATHRLAEPNSAVISMVETSDGTVWLGTRDRGLFYVSKGRITASEMKLPGAEVNSLLAQGPGDGPGNGQGDLWIGTNAGLVRSKASADVPVPLRHTPILAMVRDHDANIWVGTPKGLGRLNPNGYAADTGDSGAVTALFVDREGNLWVGGPHGIECLRDSAFVTWPVAGVRSGSSGAIYVDADDRVWYAPIEGGLRWMKGENSGSITDDSLGQDVVYSIAGSKDELWLGRQQGGLTILRLQDGAKGGAVVVKTYTERDGLAQNSVYSVHPGRDGSVWAGTVSGGVSRFKDGKFDTYTVANGLSANTLTAMEDGPDGGMWFGTPRGLSELVKGVWRRYTAHDGLPADGVTSLLRDSGGMLWVGTGGGLALLSSGHISSSEAWPQVLREPILGLAEDQGESLWIATSNHVVRVRRDALVRGPFLDTDIREFGVADGLRGTAGVKRDRSVVKDQHGAIWFSLTSGLSAVHPIRANLEASPAVAHIESVSVDGVRLGLQGPVRISPSQRRIVISYSALSLTAADRIRFRYRLDGFDHGWSEPTATRQAVYTNLSPGSYGFRVTASNSYGLWNGSDATAPFQIDPAFWQAWWFRVSFLVSLAGLSWLIYRLRLLQISRQIDMRVEERTNERTRIARELHDSLLQGFQGLLLHLQAAEHMLPTNPEEAKRAIEKVMDQGDQALAEARRAVQGLRASAQRPNDLVQALNATGKELAVEENSAQFQVMIEGKPRILEPVLRDEVFRFGREALRNAFAHAKAQNIEAEITYEEVRLILRIRDDGIGIDPKVLRQGGRPGHWGLPGMRERAESLGAEMELWSESGAGTEVQLTVPASIAYQEPTERFRLFRRKRTPRS
jgi:signal transduction histidine kinase/ligand-binding sensor domain-containing protein